MTEFESGPAVPPPQQVSGAGRDAPPASPGAPAGELITFAEAAALLGPHVTARAMRTWHENGTLLTVKAGKRRLTTAAWVREALWRNSSFTAQTESTEPSPSPACVPTSGTSHGTKDDGDASVARAWNMVAEIMRKERSRRLFFPDGHPDKLYKAPVIHLK